MKRYVGFNLVELAVLVVIPTILLAAGIKLFSLQAGILQLELPQ